MFSALRTLRYMAARHRFKAMVQSFDDRIEEARKAHKPTRDLVEAKRRFVHECLGARG